MTAERSLDEYRKKRDLRRTPEPSDRGGDRGKRSIFVVQKHNASVTPDLVGEFG